jgi:prepilin peptidase CpaA
MPPAAAEMLRWLVLFLLSILLVIVSISDIRNRRIPNWTVLAIGALFLPWIFLGPHISILSSLEAAGIVLVSSIGLYAFRIIGAGDSKLLTATALFVGLSQLPQFLVLVALAGGVIAAISLVARPTRAMVMLHMRGKGDFGRGIPYGVAIAIATLCIMLAPQTMLL